MLPNVQRVGADIWVSPQVFEEVLVVHAPPLPSTVRESVSNARGSCESFSPAGLVASSYKQS